MLVKLKEGKYLNFDYVASIQIKFDDSPESKGHNHHIIAKMIDTKELPLSVHENLKEADIELKRLVREANKRVKRIEYRD